MPSRGRRQCRSGSWTRAPAAAPTAVEEAIYFCSLEAIQNAIKHAGRDARVTVTIGREPGGVCRSTVADDGVGMQLPVHGGGIGLRCMRDRIEAVGGRLDIVSSPGAGMRVHGTHPRRALSACARAPRAHGIIRGPCTSGSGCTGTC